MAKKNEDDDRDDEDCDGDEGNANGNSGKDESDCDDEDELVEWGEYAGCELEGLAGTKCYDYSNDNIFVFQNYGGWRYGKWVRRK